MPEQLTAPAPAAPTSSTQAAPAPATTGGAASPTPPASPGGAESAESTNLDSAFDRMESRYAPKAAPEKKEAEPKPDPKVSRGTEPQKPTPPPKPTEEKKDDRQMSDGPGPKALREQLAKVNKERDELSKSIPELKAKIAEFEAKGKDTSALTEQLTREKAEKEQLMAEIRMLKKEVSPDFKQKWDKPFDAAVGYAQRIVPELIVLGEKDLESGQQITQDRPAVWSDFTALYSMPINKAISLSKKMFGDASSIVEHHLTKLKDLQFQRDTALEEEKAGWKANETREIAEQAQQRERWQKASEKTRTELINAHPELYDEDPNDPEGNELLRLGRQYMTEVPKTEDQAVRMYERNKLNAEAAPRLAHRLEKANARIAELEAQVAEFKASGPGTTRRSTQETGTGEESLSFEEEMKRAVAV